MTHGMYVCMYIRMYVCMYTCMCLCTYHTWMPCTSSLCSLKSGLYFKLTKGCMIEPGTLEWARPRLWPSSCTTALKRSLPPETAYTRICYTHTHTHTQFSHYLWQLLKTVSPTNPLEWVIGLQHSNKNNQYSRVLMLVINWHWYNHY